MATATWIKTELEEKGLPFEELQHAEAYTAQAVAQREHISGHRVAKVVVVMADGRPVQLILPASRRVDLERVRSLLDVGHIRLATEYEIAAQFPDCEVGAIPAWRHWPGVEVLMDDSLREHRDILFQAGTHCDAVHMGFDDWFRMVQPFVGQFSRPGDGWPSREGRES